MGTLRVILALSVAVWHIPGELTRWIDGSIGVIFFFIISGFYMALVINEKYRDASAVFYQARIMRIFPPYLAMCTAMLMVFTWTGTPNATSHASAFSSVGCRKNRS